MSLRVIFKESFCMSLFFVSQVSIFYFEGWTYCTFFSFSCYATNVIRKMVNVQFQEQL